MVCMDSLWRGSYYFQSYPSVCLVVWMSVRMSVCQVVNKITPELLELSSQNFQGINSASSYGRKGGQVRKRLHTVWVKLPPDIFWHFFPNSSGIFSLNFTRLLHVPFYAGLQISIQLPATLSKLGHNKRDHHNVLKMSTIDRNARLVVGGSHLIWHYFVTVGDN